MPRPLLEAGRAGRAFQRGFLKRKGALAPAGSEGQEPQSCAKALTLDRKHKPQHGEVALAAISAKIMLAADQRAHEPGSGDSLYRFLAIRA